MILLITAACSLNGTASPTPAAKSVPTLKPSRTPIPTSTPWWQNNLQGFEQVLPSGADVAYDRVWEWVGCRTCTPAPAVVAVPYHLPNGKWNVVAIAGRSRGGADIQPSIYWDWQQESIGPGYWQEIRRLASPRGSAALSFLGLDEGGQWWISIVGRGGTHEKPALLALFPVSQPQHVFIAMSSIEAPKRTWYWIVDNAQLRLYEWQDNKSNILWTTNDVPGLEVQPNLQWDFTGDKQPELTLTWLQGASALMQIYQVNGQEFRLVGQVNTTYRQHLDVDGDKVADFLWPVPASNPTSWKVFGWNGERFVWKDPMSRPTAPTPSRLDRESLPPIAADVYFRDNSWWLWPKQGGSLQPATQTPSDAGASACPNSLDKQDVVSWSPNCHFALISIHHYEGSSFDVMSADGTVDWKIPGTFTYARGNSTFAWDPTNQFLIHARADGRGGIYRLDLATGEVRDLVSLDGQDPRYGAVDPIVSAAGDIYFTIQGEDATLYPPLGVYRMSLDGHLRLLVDLPPMLVKDTYGTLVGNATKDSFVFHTPLRRDNWGNESTYSILLLIADNTVWDLKTLSENVTKFEIK